MAQRTALLHPRWDRLDPGQRHADPQLPGEVKMVPAQLRKAKNLLDQHKIVIPLSRSLEHPYVQYQSVLKHQFLQGNQDRLQG